MYQLYPMAPLYPSLCYLLLSLPSCMLSSILTIPFSKLTEVQGEIVLPFSRKWCAFPKDAVSPGGQVPHHYLESAKITQGRGLGVIYSPHMLKHTSAWAQIHTKKHKWMERNIHAHGHDAEKVCLFLPWKISRGLCDWGPVGWIQEANKTKSKHATWH